MKKTKLTPFAYDLDEVHIKKERVRARTLREAQWWKRCLAKGVCYYCGNNTPPKELTMDHIIPISRGGMSTKGNVVTSCKKCNNKKKYLLAMEWKPFE